MNKIFIISMLAVSMMGAAYAEKPESSEPVGEEIMPLLREGFGLPVSGINGLITKKRDKQKWFFSPYKDISDTRSTVRAGWPMEMLPSSTLEKIVAMMGESAKTSNSMEVKLWGKVTKYSNKGSSKKLFFGEDLPEGTVYTHNFIFPLNFIPITTVKENIPSVPDKIEKDDSDDPESIIPSEAKKLLEEPEEKLKKNKLKEKKLKEKKKEEKKTVKQDPDSILPENIKEKFKLKRVEDLSKWKKKTTTVEDATLINRTGFITQGENYRIFTIDALGRNVNDASFKLLKCETLERIEKNIHTSPGRKRYKVSGTITAFKGEYYMLLQRAVRTYNHGNFAR